MLKFKRIKCKTEEYMKRFSKICAIALSALCATSLFACGGNGDNDDDKQLDPTKTSIRICYYNGGLRDVWINDVITEFKKDFADYSFEEGKLGVDVDLSSSKDHRGANYKMSTLDTDFDVFFLEDVDYYDFKVAGNFYDITDVVTNKAITGVKDGNLVSSESKTIEEKLTPYARTYYNLGTESAPEYWAMPFHSSTMNINYNVDLFDKGYYFAKGKTAEGMSDAELEQNLPFLFTDDKENLSAGPDGVEGTYDDGMPATFADMNALMKYMVANGVTPFLWTGRSNFYITKLANEIWANVSGEDQIKLSYQLGGGEADDLVTLDDDGNIVYDGDKVKTFKETIGNDNTYKLHLSEGKLAALKFIENIFSSGDYYTKDSVNGQYTHLNAQEDFITSGYDEEAPNVAMLIDGTWWESEGRDYFDEKGANSFGNRKFGIMPIPKLDASRIGEDETKLIVCNSSVYIRGNCTGAKAEVAKTFFSYLHSDKVLNMFTAETNIMREFEYELTNESLNKMSYYGKMNYGIFHNDKVHIVPIRPLTDDAVRHCSLLNELSWGWNTGKSNSVADMLFNGAKGKSESEGGYTAEQLFKAVYEYYSKNWSKIYRG